MKRPVTAGWRDALRVMVADGRDSLEQALELFEPLLRRVARNLTRDPDLQEDLIQEGRIKLWEMDPSRYDLGRMEEVRYVARSLIRRVRWIWQVEVRL